MFGDFLQILVIMLASATKYLIGFSMSLIADYSLWETLLMCIVGGMLGVLFFTYAGDYLSKLWKYYFPPKSNKVKFNRFKRFLVKLRKSYGLMGIAFLTPIILTPPVGAIMANSIVKDKKQIFPYMLLAFTFWSVLIGGLYHFFGINLSAYI